MDFVIGIIVGIIISYIFFQFTKRKPSGTFVIDLSDPMKDVCKLELEEDLETIYKKKQMILNISHQ